MHNHKKISKNLDGVGFISTNKIKIILTAVLALTLAGCSNSFTSSSMRTQEIPQYGAVTEVPKDWLILSGDELPQDIIFAAADTTRTLDDFTPNISVMVENLGKKIQPLHFALANIQKAPQILAEYKQDEIRDITTSDDQKTKIHKFTAVSGDRKAYFIQLYLTRGDEGFTVTATLPPTASTSTIKQYEDIVRRFKFVN